MDKAFESVYGKQPRSYKVRILFTAPFWSREINSISRGPIYLAGQGHDILIITAQKADSLKGKVTASASEITEEGAEFFRPYSDSKTFTRKPSTCWAAVRDKVANFQPDVIVGFGDPFYRLPLKLSRHFNLPLVMFFEYLRDDKFSIPVRGGGKLREWSPLLYRLLSRRFRCYLTSQCSAVMFSYYGDRDLIAEIKPHCPIVRYVPWCTEIDDIPAEEKRNRKSGIYIGSLEPFKNAVELVEAIPLILDRTETEKFTVVGPGYYAQRIKELASHYGSRLVYVESVSRPEAMNMLRRAGYGYTPVTDCGLGFIGDCWGTGTPLIATHELDGFLHKNIDTLIAGGVQELPGTINSLLESDELFASMRNSGLDRYRSNFSARSVGDMYLNVLDDVVVLNRSTKQQG